MTMRGKWYKRSLTVPLLALLTAVACGTGSTQSAGSVKVIGVWSGQEQANFLAVVKPFTDQTGIKVNFESSRDEDAILTTRVGSGNPPDLAAARSKAFASMASHLVVGGTALLSLSADDVQDAAPTLAARGAGFGVPSEFVDGNDILAVYDVMQKAVERARSGQGPTLVETLTYRIGAHTTADDPTRYRDPVEVEAWRAKDPIARFQKFLARRDLLNEERIRQIVEEVEEEVNEAIQVAEAMPPMAPDSFFDYTMANLPPRWQEQRADLLRYVEREG